MTDCSKCLKNDVCNQKDIFEKVQKSIKEITISTEDNCCAFITTINKNFGIDVEINCKKFLDDNRITPF